MSSIIKFTSSKIAFENLSLYLGNFYRPRNDDISCTTNFLLLISSIDDPRAKPSFHRSQNKRLKVIEMDKDLFIDLTVVPLRMIRELYKLIRKPNECIQAGN